MKLFKSKEERIREQLADDILALDSGTIGDYLLYLHTQCIDHGASQTAPPGEPPLDIDPDDIEHFKRVTHD